MKKIIITGVGLVTPIGIGKKEVWHALIDEIKDVREIKSSPHIYEKHSGKINTQTLNKYMVDRRFRRTAHISKYAMTSVRLALDDAQTAISDNKRVSVLANVTHGALNYTQEFHKSIVTEGSGLQSPILFSDSVLNAPASNISQCFGIKGPVHSLIGGTATVIKSLILAAQMLHRGVVDKSIIVACEELSKLSVHYYSRRGINRIAEGAGAVIVETDAINKKPYSVLSAMASYFIPSHPRLALTKVIEKCLKTAGLTMTDINMVFIEPPHIKEEHLNTIAHGSLTPYTGAAFTVTTLWNIILSALIIRENIVPLALINKEEKNINQIVLSSLVQHIMICAVEKEGNAAAVVLSQYL
jgi:3-oxoacyl-(acyl-carrier-protein) synthase